MLVMFLHCSIFYNFLLLGKLLSLYSLECSVLQFLILIEGCFCQLLHASENLSVLTMVFQKWILLSSCVLAIPLLSISSEFDFLLFH